MTGFFILIASLIISETLYKINGFEDVGEWYQFGVWKKSKPEMVCCKHCLNLYSETLNSCPVCSTINHRKT